MQFRIFKNHNLIQGVSDVSFGSMAGKEGGKRAVKFLKSLGYKKIKNPIRKTKFSDEASFVWSEQVFGAKVHTCKIEDSGKTIKRADGLISNIRSQVLAIVSADCVPILLYDPKKEVVAALHGSRKSLQKEIIKEALSKMISQFNANPPDILVGIGPHIRKCHYFMDLTKKAIGDLIQSGIKRKNIEDSKICTYCSAPEYFSHRKRVDSPGVYHEKRARFASFIGLREPTLKTAVDAIKRGRVLVCPTDTVYGLVCDATNKKAVEKLFKIKKRNLKKPVPIFVQDIKAAKKLVYIDEKQEKFLKKVWPGKVTAVLNKLKVKSEKLKVYGVDKKTIGLRIPKYKFILELLKRTNKPLTGTSANISGKPASTKIKEVIKQFENQKYQPDLIISAGNLPKSRPSKVVDLTGQKMIILRR
jgi:L-threonylcarbamoyladenylate synthase